MPLYDVRNLTRRYGAGGRVALDGLSLTIDRGELVAILGTSGSGKSTLLHVLGALDRDYAGEVILDGRELRSLSDREAAALRQRMMGFVFQSFHLVPTWRVRQNVALPASFAPEPVKDLDRRVDEALSRVGLAGRGDDYPTALSGGQRQRVAIARALLMRPPVLLCDEPTGSLDLETGASILSLFESLHREGGFTIVLVTHEERATAIARRVVRIEDGRVVEDRTQTPPAVTA
ncbi:MAG: ABC transporter ATP-binding protein [Polyangiales bacterium]